MSFGAHTVDFGVDGGPCRGAGEAEGFVREARVVVRVGAGGVEVRVAVGVEEVAEGFYLRDVGTCWRAEESGAEHDCGAGVRHCLQSVQV